MATAGICRPSEPSVGSFARFATGSLGAGGLRQELDDLVQQVPHPSAVQRAHHHRLAEAEPGELPGVGLAPVRVDLVRDDNHLLAVPAHELGNNGVVPGDARRRVDHEEHEVGGPEGAERLLGHLHVELVATFEHSPGVDDEKRAPVPVALELEAVPRDAGLGLDDRDLPAREAVHERRLADVRAPDDGDDRKALGSRPAHRLASSRRRSAAPVGRDDLDARGGGASGRRAVEEAALGEADVGQQVAAVARGARRALGRGPRR